jgi:serine/threonine protein kinase
MPRDPTEFIVGDRVPGTKWVMRGKLGEGGMGVVLDVVKEPGISGAMKVMHPWFANRPEFVVRFFDEVRLLAQLRHPNIVQVFDFDRLADGTPYVVMERLLGVTLRAGLRNFREKRTPISAKLVYEIMRQLCEGLFRAHSNTPAIVHRDVKPENIFFHQPDYADTVVKIIDFGIAAVLDGTRDRRVFGTPRHMAPEQIRGNAVSPATDVYAAALVLYELLSGRFPWDIDLRDELALVDAHLHRPPVPPSRYTAWVPPLVDQWVLRALAKDPYDRPQDAYQFIAKLYELQFVNDGTSDSFVDINTTAPTLARLAEAVEGPGGASTKRDDATATVRHMSPPPVEGASLDFASGELLPPGWTQPQSSTPALNTTQRTALPETRPAPVVDRQATTRTSPQPPRPAPRRGTSVWSLPESDTPEDPPAAAVLPSPHPPLVDAQGTLAPEEVPADIPYDLPMRRITGVTREGMLPAVVGSTLVVGLFIGIVLVNRPKPMQAGTPTGVEHATSKELNSTFPVEQATAVAPAVLVPVAAPTDPPFVPPPDPSFPTTDPDAPVPSAPGVVAVPAPSVHPAGVVHLLGKPAPSHAPDDGRDLLYVRP